MATLNIKLNQEYKSFPQGFETTIEGDLVIISGVNGSGKSQLMEVIKGHQVNDPNKVIPSSMAINGVALNSKNILYRSFQSNIQQVHNIGNAEPQNFKNHKNSVWNNYTNSVLLNENHQNLRNFQKASKNAKRLLIDKFGEEKFNKGGIKQEEIITTIPDTFIWESDDIFANIVADSFLIYANEFNNMKLQNTKANFLEDAEIEEKLGVPPWKKLNDLFELLKIDYRFNGSYKARLSGLDEQPRLYPLINGAIDKQSPRQITDLSDGEKVIASLIFSTLNTTDKNEIELLLLDEFDATFNPSLTEMFYRVLDEYFVKKGIMVIIVTHSPTTISLAPEYASFYEVFRSGQSERILPVQKEQYNELQIANREFYEKIGSQKTRIEELLKEKKRLEEIQGVNTVVLVEDEFDQIYKIAWLKLNKIPCTIDNFASKFQENAGFSIFGGFAAGGIAGFLRAKNLTMFDRKSIVGIFDFDKEGTENFCHLKKNDGLWAKEIMGTKNTGFYRKRKDHESCYAILLPVPSTLEHLADIEHPNFSNFVEIENLLPEKFLRDNSLVTEMKIVSSTYLKIKDDKKKSLWKLLFSLSESDFENFRPLFERIQSICKPTENSSS